MAEWIDVARLEELPEDSHQVVDLEDAVVAVFNCNGQFYAIEDVCTHDGGILTGGPVANCIITCPRHGARFDIRTGAVLSPPAYEPIHCFPVRVQDGIVQVRDDRWD